MVDLNTEPDFCLANVHLKKCCNLSECRQSWLSSYSVSLLSKAKEPIPTLLLNPRERKNEFMHSPKAFVRN